MIMELRRRFLTKWKGRLDSAAAKADIKFFASVVGWPIELPEAMLDLLVLLVIPPDPLHCCLLGRINIANDSEMKYQFIKVEFLSTTINQSPG